MKYAPALLGRVLAPLSFALLAAPCSASADLSIAGPATPTALMLSNWYQHRLPACFAAIDSMTLYPLRDRDMDAYLTSIGLSDGTSYADSSDGEIDGLFVERQKRISVRVNPAGGVDMETLSHEYGHYVWFHLFDKCKRGEYRAIYKQQSRLHELVSDYAATNLEEGFAEAFAYFLVDPAKLNAADPASYRFLQEYVAQRDDEDTAKPQPAGAAPSQLVMRNALNQDAAAPSPMVTFTVQPLDALILTAIGGKSSR